jgi:hypothetical protein
MKKYILIIQFILTGIVLPQQVDSLIQVYPGIGDTLTFFDRTYIGLFPEVKDFNYAVFYIRNDDKLITKVYSSTNDTVKETIRIQNISSLDSIYSIVRDVAMFNNQLRSEIKDITLETKGGNLIGGQLEMFDSKYVYVFSDNVTADHIGFMRYRIPVSDIYQITIEGSSNTLLGICIGGSAGGLIGLITAFAIKEDNSSTKSCNASVSNAANVTAALVGITVAGVLIGTIVGISTSTDDNVIFFDADRDVLRLSGHTAYVLDKEMLKGKKYHDIY